MMPRLGAKFDIEMVTIEKPKDEYMTDEYFELDLPVAPAVMVGDEIVVEGTDISKRKLEAAIRQVSGKPYVTFFNNPDRYSLIGLTQIKVWNINRRFG